MDIRECFDKLKSEKDNSIKSRFPCRVILTKSRQSYSEAIEMIMPLCDKVVSSDELYCGADVMPQYDTLLNCITHGEWVLLPGVDEYLRLFYSSELKSRRFSSLWHSIVDSNNEGRIIIPLFNCGTLWNDEALGLSKQDIRQEDFFFTVDDNAAEQENTPVNVLVFSSAFEAYIGQLQSEFDLVFGLREWYERLSQFSEPIQSYWLLTRHANLVKDISSDNLSIKVINSTFDFVYSNLCDGNILTRDMCSEEVLSELLPHALRGVSLSEAILNCYNLVAFDGIAVMSGWSEMSARKQQLLQLWYTFNQDDTYLCRCVRSGDLSTLTERILLNILEVIDPCIEWINEYRRLIAVAKIKKNEGFFSKLDTIPLFEDRLNYLSADTKEERIYILRMVGKWMKTDATQVRDSAQLRNLYPSLFAYLQNLPENIDDIYSEYISDYKAYKLSNTLPNSGDAFFRGIMPDMLPSRYSLIQQNLAENTIVLWIDALGFEYLSLLLNTLHRSVIGKVTFCEIAHATPPSETKFNDQWLQMNVPYEKRDKLDKLAHKGVIDEPDYYSCIEEQISFIENIVSVVDSLLGNHQRVIITGDHGTSRLAARFFHELEGLIPPDGSTVFSHGRFCRIDAEYANIYTSMIDIKGPDNNRYLVFKTYDHFKKSGFAAGGDDANALYGEIHGGASPEEMIVPVVVVERNTALPIKAEWENSTIRVKKKKATAILHFNRAITSLQVSAGNIAAVCQTGDNIMWAVVFEGIAPDTYDVTVNADGLLVHIDEKLIVKSAIGGDGDLF